jgi:flagellar basal-body rod protein FlgC
MALFGAISTAGSGLGVYRTWLDAISDNIANINTVKPTSGPAYQEREIVAQEVPGGVAVAGAVFGNAQGRIVSEPGNPLADAQGLVRAPDMDLGDQMTQLMVAERAYQANLAVIDRARDAYLQAIQIGK